MNTIPATLGPSLADVMAQIEADEGLKATRRRDLCSALRRLSVVLDRPLEGLPASASQLRPLLNAIIPARHGLSAKTHANLRCNVLAAIRHVGIAEPRPNSLSPGWGAFRDTLTSKHLRWGLSRFMRYCSARSLSPDQVGDGIIGEFEVWLEANSLARDPRGTLRQTCSLWNEARQALTDRSLQELAVPGYKSNRMARLPLSAFPESFRADLEAYLSMRANPDLFDPEAPDKPAKANTLRLYRDQLRLAANALVERGRGPNDISYLHDLVQPEAFKDIMRQLLAEHDGAGSFWTDGIIKTLLMIAKRWCRVSHDGLNELRRLARAVPKPEAGLTPKNRAALRQFDDEQNLARLLHLPERLFREAMRENPSTLRAARKAQIATTIEFLLYCPIRIGNLLSLQLDRQILRPNGAHGPAYLCLEPEEVKNERRIDFELPQSLSKMLATYVERFLPLFGDHDGRLFVTPGGKRKSGGAFGTQLSRIIRDRTGLQLTAHQFRHLAAKLFLDAHPGGYESLRQLLGHRSIKTTIRSYAGVEMRRAAQIHDEVIEQLREELRPLAHRRCRPRPKE